MRRLAAVLVVVGAVSPPVWAWSAHGHRTITYLALDGVPASMPEWVREKPIRDRIAEESNEPDRWRSTTIRPLAHENDPDHYIDIENLTDFGLTLETVSPYRYEYVRDMAVAKYVHPEMVSAYDVDKDKDRTKEWPGFLPHAISEHYAKLRSSFNTYRILESLNDPARADQLALARENCIHEMGLLSHFVGDAAQPLHTTRHHHGWVGDNPAGFTTDRSIHAYIDGVLVDKQGLTVDSLRPSMHYDVHLNADDPWTQTLAYIRRSFEQVQPLYRLQKSGELDKEAGKEWLTERFVDAGAMLSAMYSAAWESSKPDEREVIAWVKYNNFKPEVLPAAPPGRPLGAPGQEPEPNVQAPSRGGARE
jgi:hypothetical protein